MANRKRNIQVKFYVTAEEKELMEQKMAQLQTKRIGAYLRKMAINGYIIQVDTRDFISKHGLVSVGESKVFESGTTINRPSLQELIQKARNGLMIFWSYPLLTVWGGFYGPLWNIQQSSCVWGSE